MNAVLGGLFNSRINLNLREAHGYTYGAFSAFEWRRAGGPFVVHDRGEVATSPRARRARSCTEIDRIRAERDQRGRAVARDELSRRRVPDPLRDDIGAIAAALAILVVHRSAGRLLRSLSRARARGDDRQSARCGAATSAPGSLQMVVVGDPAVIVAPLSRSLDGDGRVTPPTRAAIATKAQGRQGTTS